MGSSGGVWNEKLATCQGQNEPVKGSTYPTALPAAVGVTTRNLRNKDEK